jgi:hypothetical protein
MVKQVIRNKRQGRAVQSKMAKRIGGKNVGTIEGQDVSHPIFSGEIKNRKKFVGNTFMAQAVRNCPEGKVPIVIVHETGQRHNNNLVMIRLKDWEDLYGDLHIKKIEETDDDK